MPSTASRFDCARLTWSTNYSYTPADYARAFKKYEFSYSHLLPQAPDSAILDIGCAGGKFLHYLKKKGYTNFQGIDLHEEAIEQCRRDVTENVSMADAFAFTADHRESFDVIVCNHVIEHLSREQSQELLNACFRSLRSGGRLIIATPNALTTFVGYAMYRDLSHDHLYTSESLSEAFRLAGFDGVQCFPETPVPYSFLAAIRYWIWRVRTAYLKLVFMIDVSAGYYTPNEIIISPGLICAGRKM